MKKLLRKRLLSKQGSVLFIVLVIMSFMIILASGVYYAVMNGRQTVVMDYSDYQAFQTANDVLATMEQHFSNMIFTGVTGDDGTNDLQRAIFQKGANCHNSTPPSHVTSGANACGLACYTREAAAMWVGNPRATLDLLISTATPHPLGANRQFELGKHYLRTEIRPTNPEDGFLPGGGTVSVLVYINEKRDIVVEVTVEYNGRRVTNTRFYDDNSALSYQPRWTHPSIHPSKGLHWEWIPSTMADPPLDQQNTSTGWHRVSGMHFLNNRCWLEGKPQNGWARRIINECSPVNGRYPCDPGGWGACVCTCEPNKTTCEDKYASLSLTPARYASGQDAHYAGNGMWIWTAPYSPMASQAAVSGWQAHMVNGTAANAALGLVGNDLRNAAGEVVANGYHSFATDTIWRPYNDLTAVGAGSLVSIVPGTGTGAANPPVYVRWDYTCISTRHPAPYTDGWSQNAVGVWVYTAGQPGIPIVGGAGPDKINVDCNDAACPKWLVGIEGLLINSLAYGNANTTVINPGSPTCTHEYLLDNAADGRVQGQQCGILHSDPRNIPTMHTHCQTCSALSNPCGTPTCTTSTSGGTTVRNLDGTYTFNGPGLAWNQREAYHISGNGVNYLGNSGSTAPLYFNNEWNVMTDKNGATYGYFMADIVTPNNLLLGMMTYRAMANAPRIEIVAGKNFYAGVFPDPRPAELATLGGSFTNAEGFKNVPSTVPVNVYVQGDAFFNSQRFADSFALSNVTYYILGAATNGSTRIPNGTTTGVIIRNGVASAMTADELAHANARLTQKLGPITNAATVPPTRNVNVSTTGKWDFNSTGGFGGRTLQIAFNGNQSDDWPADGSNPLAKYGIGIGSRRNQIFYINSSAILAQPTELFNDQNVPSVIIIDTGLNSDPGGSRTINLKLGASGTFCWKGRGSQDRRMAVLTLGDGAVVFDTSDATYQVGSLTDEMNAAGGNIAIGPFNLLVGPNQATDDAWLRNNAEGDWLTARLGKFTGSNVKRGQRGHIPGRTTGCPVTDNTHSVGCFLISLLDTTGEGRIKPVLTANEINPRNHAKALNLDIYLVNNNDSGSLRFGPGSFSAVMVYAPNLVFTFNAKSDGEEVIHYGSVFASALDVGTKGFFISMLPGGGQSTGPQRTPGNGTPPQGGPQPPPRDTLTVTTPGNQDGRPINDHTASGLDSINGVGWNNVG